MRTIFVLLLMLHCISTQAQTQGEVFQILEKTYQKLTNLESISYQVNHSSKFYWKSDTILMTNQTVHIYKKPYKSHKNGVFLFEGQEILLTGKNQFYTKYNPRCVHDLNQIEGDFPSYFSLTEKNSLPKPSISHLAHIYFTNPDLLFLLKPYQVILNKVKKQETEYSQLIFNIENDKKKENRSIELWINSTTFHIEKMISRYKYVSIEGNQYDEWQFENIQENTITKDIIREKQARFDQKELLKMYANRKEAYDYESLDLLPLGIAAPAFEGWSATENRNIHSSEFLGMPVILCFWSKNMFLRDSTLKFLSDLYYEYGHLGLSTLGLVVSKRGVSNFQHITNSSAFIESKNILFPTLSINAETSSTYNAIGFPEIYILDSDGTIIKTYIGLCDSYKIEIKNILNKLLNE
jgi:outer membrane lipoprotein-sorting protein/peroxiredoxin